MKNKGLYLDLHKTTNNEILYGCKTNSTDIPIASIDTNGCDTIVIDNSIDSVDLHLEDLNTMSKW